MYSYTTNVASQISNVAELSALFVGFGVSGTLVCDPDTPLTVTQPTGAEIYVGAVMGWTGTVGSYSLSDADDGSIALIGDDTFDFAGTLSDTLLFRHGAYWCGSPG